MFQFQVVRTVNVFFWKPQNQQIIKILHITVVWAKTVKTGIAISMSLWLEKSSVCPWLLWHFICIQMKDSGDRLKEVAATSLLLFGSEPLADPIQLQGAAQVVWWEANFLQINNIQMRLNSITLRHAGIGMQITTVRDIQICEIWKSVYKNL